MAEIENLSISIGAHADEAFVAFDRLISKLNRTKIELKAFSAGAVVSALKDIKDNASAAASALNRFANAQERANRAMGGFTGARYTSTMRGAASDANTATNAIMRFVNAMATAQSAMQRMRYANASRQQMPQITGQVQEPIYTEFVDDAASSADDLREAVEGAAGGMQDMAQGARDAETATQAASEQAGRARINFGRFWNALRNVGTHVGGFFVNSVQRGVAALGTFVRSLGRIAFYRAIRSILKDLGQSFKDLYGYSKIYGVEFAKSMDRITTATTYMRNSFAAMVAPLVNLFAPVIDWIADKIVSLMNFVNQLFAAINGQDTYTVAKKVATTWESTFDSSANHAKKKIKEVKNTLLGFDEINRLNGETPSSSGSTGSSPYTPGYSTMFEEKPLEGFFAKLSGFMSSMPDWVKWLFGGGTLVGGFLLIKNFLPWVIGKIGEIFLMTPPEWISWLFSSTKKVVEVAVSLVRSGWETINGWAVSFGEAVVDLAVRVKTKIADLWASIVTAWNALNPVLQVGIVIGVTAAALWAAYQLAWQLVPDKMLEVEAVIKTAASTLKNQIVDAWAALGSWFLGVKLAVATTAEGLKSSIVDSWGKLSAWFLSVKIAVATTAEGLKSSVVDAWGKLSAWFLSVKVAVATTAEGLKTSVVDAWAKLSAWYLSVKLAVATTAEGLKSSVVDAWGKLSAWYLSVKLAVATTAEGLKSSIVNAWSKLPAWYLGVKLAIATTAEGLKSSIVNAWAKLPAWFLSVKLAISTTAEGLKTSVVTAWNKLTAWSLDVAISSADKIKTAVNNVWGWVKDNWEIVAAGALGIAIAIATPWSTIAAALSGLWADVMASFGGSLAFSIMPTLGNIFGGGKGKAAALNPNTSYYDNSTGELVIKTSPTEVQVDATPGSGFKETLVKNEFALGGIESASVTVNSTPGNGFTGKLSGTNTYTLKGIENTSVTVEAAPKWASTVGGLIPYLGLNDLATSITTSLKKVSEWKTQGIGKYLDITTQTPKVNVDLKKKWGKKTPVDYLGLSGLSTSIKVGLKSDGSKLKVRVSKGTATIESAKRRTENQESPLALGGVFSNGRWSRIPQYANGTTNAHGSLFLAGEAGPEIVGHVGGRTEVLNKSQLASAMYSAVQAAMAPAAANFASAAQSMGVESVGFDLETLAEMVRQGVEKAMGRQNELDRQRNEYLRQINEKDYNPEISTSSINKAQQRMNRRAGTTIVPVGT